ncbi:hypothetical protein E4U24_006470 [Claviceps purpurea]|nr:hypothetical protein E4U24_006470 [Claviceps purpurea]
MKKIGLNFEDRAQPWPLSPQPYALGPDCQLMVTGDEPATADYYTEVSLCSLSKKLEPRNMPLETSPYLQKSGGSIGREKV